MDLPEPAKDFPRPEKNAGISPLPGRRNRVMTGKSALARFPYVLTPER